jgi:hypothetical protein
MAQGTGRYGFRGLASQGAYGNSTNSTDEKKVEKYIFDQYGKRVINPDWIKQQEQINKSPDRVTPEMAESLQSNIDKIRGKDQNEELEPLQQLKTSAEKREKAAGLDPNKTFTIDKFGEATENLDTSPATTSGKEIEALKAQGGLLSDTQIIEQREQRAEAQRLAGQLGQFQQTEISPTGFDVGEGLITGLMDAIPSAIRAAGIGAAAGAVGGTAVAPGVGTAGGAIIGATAGFISGLSSSVISNFKSQRRDTTTAQQRVLDEGKQNLNDWVTLAATDPANRHIYVARFNQQLAQIDEAYRQMKLDTSRDVAKFETALPNLAEFETFYSAQGERDFLMADMRFSLGVQQDQEYIYRVNELARRRGEH